MRQQGKFREDLYYRLCSDVITVPPLRQRFNEDPKELDLLVQKLVTKFFNLKETNINEKNTEEVSDVISKELRKLPEDYGWPGNVRELQQAIRRILLTGHYLIEPVTKLKNPDSENVDDLLSCYCFMLYQRYGKNYTEVAKAAKLDWRTVKKYVDRYDKEICRKV